MNIIDDSEILTDVFGMAPSATSSVAYMVCATTHQTGKTQSSFRTTLCHIERTQEPHLEQASGLFSRGTLLRSHRLDSLAKFSLSKNMKSLACRFPCVFNTCTACCLRLRARQLVTRAVRSK